MKVLLLFIFLSTEIAFSQIDTNRIVEPNPSITDTIEYLVKIAWDNNPMPQLYRSKKIQAEEELHQSKWSWLDALNFTYTFDPSGSNTNSSVQSTDKLQRFGVGISVNIGSLFRVPSVIRQSEEEVLVANANLLNHRLYIRTQVIQRYALYKQNIAMLRIRSEAVNDSQSTLMLVRYRYENGETTLETYNNALRVYTDNQERQAVSIGDLAFTKASLEEILGKRWEDIFK